jgi:hypothetical protein
MRSQEVMPHMETAKFANKLNRRHKGALCATLACVGIILVTGGGVRIAVGIMFLGAAFSWALGSNKRIVHWLFVVFGLLMLVVPVAVWHSWPQRRAERIKLDKSQIEVDRGGIEIFGETVNQDSKQTEYTNEMKNDIHDLNNGYRDLMKDQGQLRDDQAETRPLRPVMRETWEYITGGLLLLFSGLGLLLGVKPARLGES